MNLLKFVIVSFLLLLCGCDYPHWNLDNFKINVQLNPDGTCSFLVDDEVISNEGYRQEVSLISNKCVGCTEDHLDGYWIWCSGKETFRKDDSAASPSLAISVVYKKGVSLHPGNYEIFEEGGRLSRVGATAAILPPPEYSMGGWANGITGTNLVVIKGLFNLHEYSEKEKAVAGELSGFAQRRVGGF